MNLFQTFSTFYWIFKLFNFYFEIYLKKTYKLYRASNLALQKKLVDCFPTKWFL